MGMALSLANFSAHEGTAAGTETITFPWKAKEVTIINAGSSGDLEFKFSSGETFGTLGFSETITVRISTKTVYLNGTVAYKVWGIG